MNLSKLLLKILTAIFLMTFCCLNHAFAADKWKSPLEVESPYSGREYTRQHFTRFWVNPYGYHLGIENADYIGGMYCSVFDKPNNLNDGYTAATDWDRTVNQSKFVQINGEFLDPYGVTKDTGTGAYLISPASYKQGGGISPFSNQSGCKYDVSIVKSTNGPDIPSPKFTVGNPFPISQGPPHFKAGAYSAGKRYYWGSAGTYGEANLTAKAASSFYTASRSTSADVIISFPYGVTVSAINLTSTGVKVGDKDRWQAIIVNSTPYRAKNVTLRAYKLEEGGTLEQIDSKVVDIEPTTLTARELAYIKYDFSVPLSDKDYTVIVTANLNIKSGSKAVTSSTATKEPLKSEFAFGIANGKPSTYSGQYEKAVLRHYSGHSGLDAYDDNWLESTKMAGGVVDDPDDAVNNAPENLLVTSIGLYERNGEPVGGTLRAGQSYIVKVSYKSTFDFSGWAKLALYFRNEDGDMRQIGDTTHYKFAPGGTFEKEYLWGASSYKGSLIGVINLDWKNGKFINLPFEGETELTYDDNKKELATSASETSRNVPTPGESSVSIYYHPVKEEYVPVYKTVKEKVWVPEVKKVRFIPADAQVRARLINEPEE